MDTEPRDSHADVPDAAPNQPNEFGFAGEGTGPEPTRETAGESATELSEDELAEAEEIAVPAGDLTGALTEAVERVTDQEPDQESDR